jgi:hypothetical protein
VSDDIDDSWLIRPIARIHAPDLDRSGDEFGRPWGWDLDGAVSDAIDGGCGSYSEDISELFETGQGQRLVRVVCGLCENNREIGSIRRVTVDGIPLVIAGRREVVAIRHVVARRELRREDGLPDGRRRAPRVWVVQPVLGDDVTAWCSVHHHMRVPGTELVDTLQRHYAKDPLGRRDPAVLRVRDTVKR